MSISTITQEKFASKHVLRKLVKSPTIESVTEVNRLRKVKTMLCNKDKFDTLEDNKIHQFFFDEDRLLEIEEIEVKKKKKKIEVLRRLFKTKIRNIRVFDEFAGRLMYCDWSGENIDPEIETKYNYDQLIEKFANMNANLFSESSYVFIFMLYLIYFNFFI